MVQGMKINHGHRHSQAATVPTRKFEGYVLGVGPDTFWARVHDVYCPENAAEDWEMLIAKVSQSEREFLREGAYFSFDGHSGRIQFRRDVWTAEELAEAEREAAVLHEVFNG